MKADMPKTSGNSLARKKMPLNKLSSCSRFNAKYRHPMQLVWNVKYVKRPVYLVTMGRTLETGGISRTPDEASTTNRPNEIKARSNCILLA